MNSRGFQLAISTVILLVLGVLILVGLIYFITDGFDKFSGVSDPLIDSTEGSAVKQACELACDTEDVYTYCCGDFELGDEVVRCDDSRLAVECGLSCAAVSCVSTG